MIEDTCDQADPVHQRILVLAPLGQDASLAQRLLEKADLCAEICCNLEGLCQGIEEGAGVACLTEEALASGNFQKLTQVLDRQPPWSALPLIILTHKHRIAAAERPILTVPKALRNATFLERPVRIMTLISVAQAALEARRRQYLVRDLLTKLENNVRQRDEFLAMLGHELRNPLAAIGNAIELLKLLDGEPPPLQTALNILDRQTVHLTRMLDDLLDVSRVTRGMIQLRKEIVNVEAIVSDAMEEVKTLFQKRGHRIETSLPSQALWLEADPTRLRQVLANLLNNAAKYTEPGGHIRLSVKQDVKGVEIRVRDNGMGMTAETLTRIFDLFAQSKRALDRVQGGLGIGLTLVRRLVQLHGGRVTASSAGLGQGSEFVVRLPLAAKPPQPRPSSGTSSANKEHPGRIMVVDDNVDLAQGLGMLLSELGYQVDIVHDGQEAIKQARVHQPEVILLDIGLPGMDGYQVAKRLRANPAFARTLLIALTGYSSQADHHRSREAGFDHHLVKPVKLERLCQLLASVPS